MIFRNIFREMQSAVRLPRLLIGQEQSFELCLVSYTSFIDGNNVPWEPLDPLKLFLGRGGKSLRPTSA